MISIKTVKNNTIKSVFSYIDKHNSKCKICLKNVKTSGNTTNLKTHIIRHHKQIYLNEDNSDDPTASSSIENTAETDKSINYTFYDILYNNLVFLILYLL